MATVNSLFSLKKYNLIFVLSLTLVSCQIANKRGVPVGKASEQATAPTVTPAESTPPSASHREEEAPSPAPVAPPMQMGVAPKVGLILGPGALRSFAHVGVVQEFAKQKMPLHIVGGIEMGALVAAIYANKGLPFDVEWQMMKLKESDLVQKGLLSTQVKPGEVKTLNEFMNIALSSNRAENSKVQFVCPALNLDQQQVYMMNKGAFAEMLPFCLAFPPLFRPHQQNVSAVFSLKALVDYMRAKGATYIVYVDVLGGGLKANGISMESEVLWGLTAEALSRQEKGVDYIVKVPLKEYDLLDYSRRRELIQKGQKSAIESAAKIMKNW